MSGVPADWTQRLEGRAGPIYLQLVALMAEDIGQGVLAPGARLPTQRDLAKALRIDPTTVSRAFAEAQRRGLIDATVGRGTFVRSAAPSAVVQRPPPASAVDMTMNLPPLPAAAALAERMRDGLAAALGGGDDSLLQYRDTRLAAEDRAAGAQWLGARLPGLAVERVLVAAGAQAALLAALAAVARAGETVLAERIAYPGLRAAAALLGVRLVGVAIDRDGLVPEALDEAVRAHAPKALAIVPTLHNPTTATMPLGRREAVAAIARRHGLPILEDDPYSPLLRDAPPPLAALAPELTIHLASLSKVLTPALRVAYVAVPDAGWAARLQAGLRATTTMPPPLMTALATRWVGDGTAVAILDAIRAEFAARQALARPLLKDLAIASDPVAHHLWLTLPAGWPRGDFVAHMQRLGLAVVPSDAFLVDGPAPEAVRLCLGAAQDQATLRRALALLAATLAQRPSALMPQVV